MGLADIWRDWNNPTKKLLSTFGNRDDVRKALWGQIVDPVQRHLMKHLQQDVRSRHSDVIAEWLADLGKGQDQTNCTSPRAKADRNHEKTDDKDDTLQGSAETPKKIMQYGNDPNRLPLSPIFQAHLMCALEVIKAGPRWTSSATGEALGAHALKCRVATGLMLDLAHELAGGEKRKHESTIVAPVALVLHGRDGGATLAQFRFERIPNGRGELYITPEQAFLRMDGDFAESILDAARRAVQNFLGSDKYPDCDVRLRIESFASSPGVDGGEFFREDLCGRSASGAAAWALYFLLTKKVPDAGLITLAQIDSTGQLSGFRGHGVPMKVAEIASDKYACFDTIIVADSEDYAAAFETLRTVKKADAIRVVNLEEAPCQAPTSED